MDKVTLQSVLQMHTADRKKGTVNSSEDRLDLLVHSTKEDIMTFLKWILDFYPRVRKRSSLHEYWRVWCMLYRKSVGHSLHAKVMEEVNDVWITLTSGRKRRITSLS